MAVEGARPQENTNTLLAGINAVYDAVGVRIKDLLITPDKVLKALAEKEGGQGEMLWFRFRKGDRL